MKKRYKPKKTSKRGIYILPNLLTSFSLFGGLYAIIAAIHAKYDVAAIAILISSMMDGLDGKIARYTNTASKFGAEYDSLSDLVAFGVAPGILIYKWSLEPFGRFGWLAVFLYIICGALRLARFNIQKNSLESFHFKGLPIPGAAIFIATLVLFVNSLGGLAESKHIFIIISIYILSFLMVSTINYISFKKLELFKRKPFNTLVATILLFILVAYKPALMLFIFSSIYIITGPAVFLFQRVRGRDRKAEHSVIESYANEKKSD